MRELRELLGKRSEEVPLDVAALQIAQLEYPDLEIEPYLVLLDSYASEFSERAHEGLSGPEFFNLLNQYLFEELGFRGNTSDYYNATNSCLNDVLTSRVGIPITLSLVYVEIARRLGRDVYGVALPGHFVVEFDEPDFNAYVDPFHGGRVLSAEECFELAREATGVELEDDPDLLSRASKWQIAIRMLNNLRTIYYRQQAFEKAIRILDLMIEAMPEVAEEYKQRGACKIQLQRFTEARADLAKYLKLAPDAPDAELVATEVARLDKLIALA
jgi:regulator of sirC expression with transglutaminase-like and TPR domain